MIELIDYFIGGLFRSYGRVNVGEDWSWLLVLHLLDVNPQVPEFTLFVPLTTFSLTEMLQNPLCRLKRTFTASRASVVVVLVGICLQGVSQGVHCWGENVKESVYNKAKQMIYYERVIKTNKEPLAQRKPK